MTYTIERFKNFTPSLGRFVKEEFPKIAEMFDGKFNPDNAMYEMMIKRGIFLVCKRDGEITGIHLSFLTKSVFDCEVKILQQQLFYVKPDSGRTAYHLFKKFIDIGKLEADHIITMLTSKTNIKPETLFKMGFSELETLYRLEV